MVVQPPVADAGADQTVAPGALVTLDGSGSFDPQGLALGYSWVQTGGTSVVLSDASAVSPTFTAPAVDETLTFDLTVTNTAGLSDSDDTSVTIEVQPPVADVGQVQPSELGGAQPVEGDQRGDRGPGRVGGGQRVPDLVEAGGQGLAPFDLADIGAGDGVAEDHLVGLEGREDRPQRQPERGSGGAGGRQDGGDERHARGRAAAVVRGEDEVRAQTLAAPQERTLARTLDVAGQEDPATGRFDQQHAGAVVEAAAKALAGMQHAEAHAVALPGLARATLQSAVARGPCPTQVLRVRIAREHRVRSAGVVRVPVADDEHVQASYAERAQRRHDRPRPCVAARPGRPGVIQHG